MRRQAEPTRPVLASSWLVDTHTHLDEPAFDADRDEVVGRAIEVGVTNFVNIAFCPERWRTTRILQKTYPQISVAAGLHPNHAADFDATTVDILRSILEQSHCVAVGEIGFDFFRPGYDMALQRHVFEAQLALAAEIGLPAVIHQRSAEAASVEVLGAAPQSVPIVLHSFDGTWRLGRMGIERGYYFGVGGLMTRATATTVRDILAVVPVEQLLLETDAPYLTPAGVKPRRNEPANIAVVAQHLAELRGTSVHEITIKTTENARRVFGVEIPTG